MTITSTKSSDSIPSGMKTRHCVAPRVRTCVCALRVPRSLPPPLIHLGVSYRRRWCGSHDSHEGEESTALARARKLHFILKLHDPSYERAFIREPLAFHYFRLGRCSAAPFTPQSLLFRLANRSTYNINKALARITNTATSCRYVFQLKVVLEQFFIR